MKDTRPTAVVTIAPVLWLALASLGSVLAAPAQTSPRPAARTDATRSRDEGAQRLFEEVLRRLAGYKDFQARFVEISESRAGSSAARESGQVFFKRPDLWRWQYTDPERKVVLVRGRDAEIAIEGDPQVSRYDLGSGDGPSGIGSLLSGGEALSRSFAASILPGDDASLALLRLDPLALSDDFDYILLRVHRPELTVREVVIVDPGGNRLRFQFEDLRPDRGLNEALFHSLTSEKGAGSDARKEPKQP